MTQGIIPRAAVLAAMILVTAGCKDAGSLRPTPRPSKTGKTSTPSGPGPKGPAPKTTFMPGPAIKPSKALLLWLEGTKARDGKPRRQVRLPVFVRFDSAHRMALRQAWIGKNAPGKETDVVPLALEDGAMGISLLDRLRETRCGKGESCAVWLEGYWGPHLALGPPLPGKRKAGAARPFAVRRVHGLVDRETKAGTLRAFVEKSAP